MTMTSMKIDFKEIVIKINLIPERERKHINILANALITLKDIEGSYMTISGFTVWRSKHGGLNPTVPQSKNGFKYCQFEPGFWRRLKLEIIKAYEYEIIPISGEDKEEK